MSLGSYIKMLTPSRNVGFSLRVGCEKLGLLKEFGLFRMCVELAIFEANATTCNVIHLI